MNDVYLNGTFLPLENAKISILDRGFLFGDGVYEVISIYRGKLFRPLTHLSRLQESLDSLSLSSANYSNETWLDIFHQLIQRNQAIDKDKAIYLQITRGADTKRDHVMPDHAVTPTRLVMLTEFPHISQAVLEKGLSAITHNDTRWDYSHIKSLNNLASILLLEEAKKQHAQEVLLIRDGYVMEGARNNVFIVSKGIIKTHPMNQHMLGGITREVIIEIAKNNHIPLQCEPFSLAELYAADEVWITSSIMEICPIIQVDGKPIHQGKVGPMWHQMIQLFRDTIQKG